MDIVDLSKVCQTSSRTYPILWSLKDSIIFGIAYVRNGYSGSVKDMSNVKPNIADSDYETIVTRTTVNTRNMTKHKTETYLAVEGCFDITRDNRMKQID